MIEKNRILLIFLTNLFFVFFFLTCVWCHAIEKFVFTVHLFVWFCVFRRNDFKQVLLTISLIQLGDPNRDVTTGFVPLLLNGMLLGMF